MKKVIIIGAGIAGMTCGIDLQRNGFETEIFEMNHMAGGECTGWDRGEYHFDGCIHWLVGSKQGTGLNSVWRDTGALNDAVRIINHDAYMRFEEGGKAVMLYTNADKLEKHLLEIAPEDKAEIKKLCAAIRALRNFGMPLDRPMDMMTMGDGMKFAAKNLRGLPAMSKYTKMTMKELADRFKNSLVKNAILASIPGDYTAVALVSTLGGMNAGDCGFPEGGSRAFALRMEKQYLSLGGQVIYRARVDKVIVKDGSAVGIRLADGSEHFADEVVSCADGYTTLKGMLEDKYTPSMYENLYNQPKKYPTPTCALVFMGVDADIPYVCRAVDVGREKPVTLSGGETSRASLMHYGFDKSMAPEGKTVMACYYATDYDFWKTAHADRARYKAEKKRLEEDAIEVLITHFPEAKGHIDVTDVVTPMTYERYCNAWRGSWMTWGNGSKDVPQYFPGMLEGLDHFLMAGIWTMPPGGLPSAAASGRFAAQRLCMRYGVKFA